MKVRKRKICAAEGCSRPITNMHGNYITCSPACNLARVRERHRITYDRRKREEQEELAVLNRVRLVLPEEKPMPDAVSAAVKCSDESVAAAVKRYDELADRYNTLLRFCKAIPLLITVRVGMDQTKNIVELDQVYLDTLAKLVAEVEAML